MGVRLGVRLRLRVMITSRADPPQLQAHLGAGHAAHLGWG